MDATHGMDVATAVDRWRLGPHPEGGFFRETYRSTLRTLPAGWPGERALATAILYLLPAGQESDWHRVRGDELWLWQGGAPMELRIGAETRQVGPDPEAGHEPQVLVPAGCVAVRHTRHHICRRGRTSGLLVPGRLRGHAGLRLRRLRAALNLGLPLSSFRGRGAGSATLLRRSARWGMG